jgi:hypothetical protein
MSVSCCDHVCGKVGLCPGTDDSMSKPQNHLMQFSIEMKNEGNGHWSVREMRRIPGDY